MEIENNNNINNSLIQTTTNLIYQNLSDYNQNLTISWITFNFNSSISGSNYLKLIIYTGIDESPNILETIFVTCTPSTIRFDTTFLLEPNYKFGIIKGLNSDIIINYSILKIVE